MVSLRRRTIDNSVEDSILTGMIVSDKFCRDIHKIYRKEYLQTPYAQTIAKWCLDYYSKYKEAPYQKIQSIFHIEKENIKEVDVEIISAFLERISTQYEQRDSFNSDYIIDEAKKYFDKRSIKIIASNADALVELNRIEEAKKEIQKYREVSKENTNWVNPLAEDEIKKYFQDEKERTDQLFTLPGALGTLIGGFERGQLFSVFAPVKRGKCIREGSTVLLGDGSLKPIEKIVQDRTDTEAFSLNDKGKIVRSRIVDYFDNGEKECFRITTRTGRTIDVTDNHPLFTPNGWKELKDIIIGTEIAILNSKMITDICNSNIIWDQIVSIKSIGKYRTYDLTIEKYHNFIANDIFVHNSFWLQEIAIQAILEHFKAIYISLEMNIFKVKRRIYKRLTALADEEGEITYSCFDCVKNQKNICRKPERKNKIKLVDNEGNKPSFEKSNPYRPCEICRKTPDFEPGSWFVVEKRGKLEQKRALKTIKGINQVINNNYRIMAYPAFSANLARIRSDIEELEYSEGFIPDVIAIDYPDILAPEDSRITGRERIDETWKMLKNMADTRHCLIAVASQTNRGSFEKKYVVQTDAAEDIRKFAHIDIGIALNQLPQEKREGITRISLIAERDGEFDQYLSCMVLQQLSLGQPFLDSEMLKPEKKDKL